MADDHGKESQRAGAAARRAGDHSTGPNRRDDRGRNWPPPYGFTQMRGTHRIYVSRFGPFGFALIMLVVGFLAAIMLLF